MNSTIQEFRHAIGMTQKQFSDEFGIPIGTLRNWEQGISEPPEYVFTMIVATFRRDYMINAETIKLIGIIKRLAEYSANGISDFEEATQKTWGTKLFFDRNTEDENGNYRVVCDACIIDDYECIHHDAISYWDDLGNSSEYTIRAVKDDTSDEYYIDITLVKSGISFVVENGDWYCADYGV